MGSTAGPFTIKTSDISQKENTQIQNATVASELSNYDKKGKKPHKIKNRFTSNDLFDTLNLRVAHDDLL